MHLLVAALGMKTIFMHGAFKRSWFTVLGNGVFMFLVPLQFAGRNRHHTVCLLENSLNI